MTTYGISMITSDYGMVRIGDKQWFASFIMGVVGGSFFGLCSPVRIEPVWAGLIFGVCFCSLSIYFGRCVSDG